MGLSQSFLGKFEQMIPPSQYSCIATLRTQVVYRMGIRLSKNHLLILSMAVTMSMIFKVASGSSSISILSNSYSIYILFLVVASSSSSSSSSNSSSSSSSSRLLVVVPVLLVVLLLVVIVNHSSSSSSSSSVL